MKERVFAESNKLQLPQFGNLSGEGQFVFVLPDAARATGGDERARFREEQRRLDEERARLDVERRRFEAERERTQTPVAALPPPADPPRGRLLYELDLNQPPPGGNVAKGNRSVDQVSFVGRAVEFKVSNWAVVQVPGEFDDFVAEARATPVRGDGYFALQFHLGSGPYQAIRLLPVRGTLLVTLAAAGPHQIEDERQLSGSVIRIPVVRHGEEVVLTAIVRGEEIVVYTEGVEAARVRDRSATRGALEFAVGTLREAVRSISRA